jgi:hypothetical protein
VLLAYIPIIAHYWQWQSLDSGLVNVVVYCLFLFFIDMEKLPIVFTYLFVHFNGFKASILKPQQRMMYMQLGCLFSLVIQIFVGVCISKFSIFLCIYSVWISQQQRVRVAPSWYPGLEPLIPTKPCILCIWIMSGGLGSHICSLSTSHKLYIYRCVDNLTGPWLTGKYISPWIFNILIMN